MKNKSIIYFDNAATTFPKPQVTAKAIFESMAKHGGNPGRAGHRLSVAAAHDIYRLRERAAEFFGCSKPENVIVTFNTTHALNIAIKSVFDKGDTALCSDMEHNAVRRPLNSLMLTQGVKTSCFSTSINPEVTLNSIKKCCEGSKPKALVCLHGSNICQRVLPAKQIGEYCRNNGIFFILDAAQSAGHEKIEFDKWGIDALCIPGHKGLYGPMGTGLLILSQKFADHIAGKTTLLDGGSGIDSQSPLMPDTLPERFEAGTIPAPLCAGLCASIDFVDKIGLDCIAYREHILYCRLMDILTSNKKVIVYLPEYKSGSVISFNVKGMSPSETADYFDRVGICMRAGLYCRKTGLPVGSSNRTVQAAANTEFLFHATI